MRVNEMGDNFQYVDIIFLAMIAAFIALRLRSVLGRRTGDEPSRTGQGFPAPAKEAGAPLAADGQPLGPDADLALLKLAPLSDAYKGIVKIRNKDRRFDGMAFVTGAQSAYDMILEAFWTGDTATLKALVSTEVYGHFEKAILDRQQAGLVVGNKLMSIRAATVEEAELEGNMARITLKFVSDLILVTKDSENRVIEGDVSDTVEVIDIWTFERDLGKSDPNWILVTTRSGQ
jgi:predicted lipid-binding transport protein (Tim44 family)